MVVLLLHHLMPRMLLHRSLLYTAVSRPSRLLVVIGTEKALKRCVDTPSSAKQLAKLPEWLAEQIGVRQLRHYVAEVFDGGAQIVEPASVGAQTAKEVSSNSSDGSSKSRSRRSSSICSSRRSMSSNSRGKGTAA